MQQYVYDIVINHGQFFDGSCRDGVIRHLGIRDGRVVTISDVPLPLHAAPRVYDATGQWVTPGFIPHRRKPRKSKGGSSGECGTG